jgi:hypothetical protein
VLKKYLEEGEKLVDSLEGEDDRQIAAIARTKLDFVHER